MSIFFKKISERIGLPPGTIIQTVTPDKDMCITVFDYDNKNLHEQVVQNIEECFPFKDSPTVTWINIEGIDSEVIKKIDEHFGIHPLVSEDIINLGQRPKMEDYGNYLYIVFKRLYLAEERNEIIDEQISLILGLNFVISIQEKQSDFFSVIKTRIRESKGRIRTMKSDYLAYTLLDSVVDNYFLLLEKRGENIELLENEIMTNPHNQIMHSIHKIKRDMIYFKKQAWPLREVISALQKNESNLIRKQTRLYLTDVYDHNIHIIETIESFRDMLSGLHDIYLSTISNKMNEIMKVLTIFAAIFIPLTFMAGIYGMNFEFMPELKWKYGYFVLLTLMFSVGFGMLFCFKKKKWI